jgi:hypothetical protein
MWYNTNKKTFILNHSICLKNRIKIRLVVLKIKALIGTDSGQRLCFILCYDADYDCTQTYHSRFIHTGVAKPSQIFLRDTHFLPKRLSNKENCRCYRWQVHRCQITVYQAWVLLVHKSPFTTSMENGDVLFYSRERCYSIHLSWKPHQLLGIYCFYY